MGGKEKFKRGNMNKPSAEDFKYLMNFYDTEIYSQNKFHYSSIAEEKVFNFYFNNLESTLLKPEIAKQLFKQEYPEEYLLWKMKNI